MNFPAPKTQPGVGHLGRWGRAPLPLLEEGAALGPVFRLQLWRPTVVGYSPDWNRFVLGDVRTFRSKGSMSGLSPYLGAGVVRTDEPDHRPRRRELNPHFTHRSVQDLRPCIADIAVRRLPLGPFDAVAWAAATVREILAATFFGGLFPPRLLAQFLRPLDRALPAPLLRRPLLFYRMNRALAHALAIAPSGTLGAALWELPGGLEEARVALSAGYDTTAHTLAWLLFHAAGHPRWCEPDMREAVIDEVLRLYPAGWLGSRRCAENTAFAGVTIAAGTLVLYSPYLTHRDPTLWKEPLSFQPGRFADPLPPWGYIPFAAGERTCLGRPLARLILDSVLSAFAGSQLDHVQGDPRPRAAITLAPAEPLLLRRKV